MQLRLYLTTDMRLHLFRFVICWQNDQTLMQVGTFFVGIQSDACWCKVINRGIAQKLQGCIMQVYEYAVL